jgi:lysine biosynthesis protein LysW
MARRLKTAILGTNANAGREAPPQPGPAIWENAPHDQTPSPSDHPQDAIRWEPKIDNAKKQIIVTCVNCGSTIKLGFHPIDGQILCCVVCGVDLEVINDQPLELAIYSEEWDDDDE